MRASRNLCMRSLCVVENLPPPPPLPSPPLPSLPPLPPLPPLPLSLPSSPSSLLSLPSLPPLPSLLSLPSLPPSLPSLPPSSPLPPLPPLPPVVLTRLRGGICLHQNAWMNLITCSLNNNLLLHIPQILPQLVWQRTHLDDWTWTPKLCHLKVFTGSLL